MSKKYGIALAMMCLICASGCNGAQEAPKPETSQLQPPAVDVEAKADDAETAPTAPSEATPDMRACKNGEESGEDCLCGKAAIKRADVSDWACGNGFWRCMNSKGCQNDGTPYPLGSDMTEHGIQCGSRGDIPSLERFACDMDKSAWICIKKDCDCHGAEIQKGEMCLSNTCHGLTLENSDGLECSENGWKVLKAGAHTIGGKVYTLPEGIGIGRGIFTCSGHETNHPDHPVEYEMLWANVSQYACREIDVSWNLGKHWICEADTCECGNEQCKKGEQCDNGKCVDLVRPCETGNCPCGNGTCMKGATCIDGHCICGMPDGDMVREFSDPDELPININDKYWVSDEGNIGRYSNLFVSNRYGEFTCDEYFIEGTCYSYTYFPRCENEKGCRTTDGRHFDAGSSLIHRQSYHHIDAGFDTVRVSTEDGTCVLPRHDDLKRKRDAGDNPKEYICDEEICMCGQEKCFMGQICRLGNCEDDICHISDAHKSKVFIKDDPNCYEDDDQIEDDTREPKCEGKWILGYDPVKCIGGTRYCRGYDDPESRPAPKDPKGYVCANTDNRENAHKAWTCSAAEVCQCGGKPCPKGGICIDEKCIVDEQPSIDENSQLENNQLENSTIEDNKGTLPENNKEDSKDEKAEDNKQIDSKDEKAEDNKQEDNNAGTPAINDPSSKCYDASPGEGYVCKSIMKSNDSRPMWICNLPEGCTCNDKFCPQNATCDKEGIKCGEYLLHDSNPHQYACKNKGGEFYAAWLWECVDPAGCTCGNHLCRNFEICESSTCTCNGTIIPGPNYVCEYNMQYHPAWICKDPNSCECPGENNKSSGSPCYPGMLANTVVRNDAYYCGDNPMPKDYRNYLCNEAHQMICNDSSCICSDGKTHSICPQYAMCYKGKCLHPGTKKPMSPDKDGYYTEGLMRLCMKEKCMCNGAETPCESGEYCMLGKCASPVVVYQNDQYFVGEYTSYDECPSHDELPEAEYPEWKDDYLSYYFHIQESSRPVCSSWDFDYSETLICGLPSGCACGDIICPMGSTCLGDRCYYDENARDGQPIDKDNNISCKLTTLKAPRHDFKCDALGWTCQGTDCPCGDKDCKTGEICIAPGTCAPIIQ